jgi:hypothetical protein
MQYVHYSPYYASNAYYTRNAHNVKAQDETLRAALALGDVTLAEAEVMWKECLPDELRLSGQAAHRYLDIYYRAARAQLDRRVAMVVERVAQWRAESRAPAVSSSSLG